VNNEVSVVIAISKHSSLRNDRSINLNLSDHVRFLRENMTIAGKKFQKEKTVLRVKDSLSIIILHVRGDHYVSLISLQLRSGI